MKSVPKFPINITKIKWLVFLGLILLAVFLRVYKFGQVPHGMTWDEAAIGYNGHAIAVAHRDEWLRFMPISFKSFGDFKAPLAIYVNAIFTAALGLELWVVRLPFLLASLVAILGFYLLIDQLLINSEIKLPWSKCWPLLGMGLLVVSPWHLHYSRAGFESGMALMFVIFMVWGWLKFIQARGKISKTVGLTFFVTSAVLAIYSYHSSKLVVPLLAGWLMFLDKDKLKANWRWLIGGGISGLIGVSLFVYDTLFGQGGARFAQTSILSFDSSGFEKARLIITQWLDHWSPQFLIFGQTETLRHGTGAWGVILPTTFILFWLGLVAGGFSQFKKPVKNTRFWQRWFWLGLGWWSIGLIPAAIGFESPHSNRVLLALPGLLILSLFGLARVYLYFSSKKWQRIATGSHGENQIILKLVVGLLLLFHLLFALKSANYYFTDFAANSAEAFQDGYLETFDYILPYELGQREFKPEKIVFTGEYGQPYIYALFARRTNPIWYSGGSLVKYEFTDVKVGDLERQNTIVVAPPSPDLPLEMADHIVFGSNGQPRFLIYLLND